jgi:DNA-binding NarL/FixJ family response regulator
VDEIGAIRVLVVDDHPIVLSGLTSSLSAAPSIQVVGRAASLARARDALAQTAVDVGLLDVRLPDGPGLDLIGSVDARDAHPNWIVLSSFETAQYVAAAVRLGAAGYLLKTAPLDDIVAAIRTVARGGTAFAARYLAIARDAGPLALSQRERDVVAGVIAGQSNEEIAADLRVSRKTVEAYLTRLFERFQVISRTELALRAERDGLLEAPRFGRTRRQS